MKSIVLKRINIDGLLSQITEGNAAVVTKKVSAALNDYPDGKLNVYSFKVYSRDYCQVNQGADGVYQLTYDMLKEQKVYWLDVSGFSYDIPADKMFVCYDEEGQRHELGAYVKINARVDSIAPLRELLIKADWADAIRLNELMGLVQDACIAAFRKITDGWNMTDYNAVVDRLRSEAFAKAAHTALYGILYKAGISLVKSARYPYGIEVDRIQPMPAVKKPGREAEAEYPPVEDEEPEFFQPASAVTDGSAAQDSVLLGRDQNDLPVYWPYWHKSLPNRHLLITGGSGQGKTYCIQTLMYELMKRNVSSVVFDYSASFTPQQMEPALKTRAGSKLIQLVALTNKLPFNPFVRHQITIGDQTQTESSVDVAARIADIFEHVYDFGEQQRAAIYRAVRKSIDEYGDSTSFKTFQRELMQDDSAPAKSAYAKTQSFFDRDLIAVNSACTDASIRQLLNSKGEFEWRSLLDQEGRIIVIQLQGLDRSTQTIITELLMWDAWYAFSQMGRKDQPFVAVFDEAQNLSLRDSSPAGKILREGRRYGWSAWFSTQYLPPKSENAANNLFLAEETLYFRPSNPKQIQSMAKQFADTTGVPAERWNRQLTNLGKGDCLVVGHEHTANGLRPAAPRKTHISSFDERK